MGLEALFHLLSLIFPQEAGVNEEWPEAVTCLETGIWGVVNSEEDKRATTNVQHRFVLFFLLSSLLVCSH